MLITDAPDSSPARFGDNPDKDTLDASTRADLESGAISLKMDLEGRTKQRKQLVKENFDCFVSCKTTIDDIESKLKRIEDDPEGAGTAYLHHCINNISSVANHAFQPLFERQVQTEKIRSVQGMLQRFRMLFNLPSAIRGSISKGEFDLAVREYKKAKSIVLPSHVGILKRVLEEAEKLVQEFKLSLYKSMEDPQIDLAENPSPAMIPNGGRRRRDPNSFISFSVQLSTTTPQSGSNDSAKIWQDSWIFDAEHPSRPISSVVFSMRERQRLNKAWQIERHGSSNPSDSGSLAAAAFSSITVGENPSPLPLAADEPSRCHASARPPHASLVENPPA
ncbi:hypothetical protein ACLOJK_034655 [Asimina triloba]